MSKQSAPRWVFRRTASSTPQHWLRRTSRVLPLLLVVLLLFGTMPSPVAAAPDETRVLPQLQNEAAAQPAKTFRVIVTRNNRDTGADTAVAGRRGNKIKDLPHDAFVANLPGAAIAALGRNPAVKFIAPDAVMINTDTVDSSNLATLYPTTINAPSLWSSSESGSSVTGKGIGVAVLDTGIAGRSDWNSASGTSRIAKQVKFNSTASNLNDGFGHGTHVAGIIAGNSGDPQKGKYIGIAPEATLINVKVSDDSGKSYVSDLVSALDWVIANRQTYNIRVVNLSMVSSVAESYLTSTLDAAVERAWFNGILVVVAAGNAGPGTVGYAPANDPFVVTVGAADPMDTQAQQDDTIAPWSSYGATQDGYVKPDIVAPGRYIVAPLASSGCTLAKLFPDRIVDGSYIRMSGTSMAAPVVAGLAALAFQAHPEWTNDQLKWLLLRTATPLGTTTTTSSTDPATGLSTTLPLFTPLPGQGAGEVNAAAVVRYRDTPGLANQGLAINQLLVGPNGATNYTNQPTGNWSTANWSTANWSTANWSTANWSTANWSTANWSTANWSSMAKVE
jgi:serine protease AprX